MEKEVNKTNERLKLIMPTGNKKLSESVRRRIRRIKLIAKSNDNPIQSVLYEDIIYLDFDNVVRFTQMLDTLNNIMDYIRFFKTATLKNFLKPNVTLILITTDYCFGKELTKVVNDCGSDDIMHFLCIII